METGPTVPSGENRGRGPGPCGRGAGPARSPEPAYPSPMDDIATQAVEAALAAGATYADARVMEIRTEAMNARNGVIEGLDREERAGVGVRALIGSSWGFFAVPDVGSTAARRAGEGAAAVARASTRVAGKPLQLTPEAPVTATSPDAGFSP